MEIVILYVALGIWLLWLSVKYTRRITSVILRAVIPAIVFAVWFSPGAVAGEGGVGPAPLWLAFLSSSRSRQDIYYCAIIFAIVWGIAFIVLLCIFSFLKWLKYRGITLTWALICQIINKPAFLKTIIVILIISLFTSLSCLKHANWLNSWWAGEVHDLAITVGQTRALNDFQQGKVRLFVISDERARDEYSGTNDGPFQIWFSHYWTEIPPQGYSVERQIDAYNREMRDVYEHSNEFLAATNFMNSILVSP